MIPYKDIGDNLTVNEFNGIVSLLRDNINFSEDIQINTSTVTGEYGKYVFDFNEATVLDNGILITNETLSTVGTVMLTNPVFPHSHYFLDMKVYSSEDIGISGMDHSDIIVTNLTIPLEMGVEVNIPFQTLDMNNIVGFDAVIRIKHNDLVIRTADHISLTANFSSVVDYCPVTFSAVYTDEYGVATEGKTINFYEGETLLGTATTNSEGIATLNHGFSTIATHTVFATCESISSDNVNVSVNRTNALDITITGNKFDTNSSSPFNLVDSKLSVNFGDNSGAVYSTGKLTHNYSSSGNYEIFIGGSMNQIKDDAFNFFDDSSMQGIIKTITFPSNVTKIGDNAFRKNTGLTSITLPSDLTTLGEQSFYQCSNLTSISIPSGVTSIPKGCFGYCKLSSVSIPNSVTSLGNFAFAGLKLSEPTLPNNLQSIGQNCFTSSSVLEKMNIPASVTSIGIGAFGYCTNLKKITLNWDNSTDIVPYDETWIEGSSQFSKFRIPQNTTALYTNKGYPSSLLEEIVTVSSVTVTASPSTIATSTSSTLSATVKDDGNIPLPNQTVYFYDGVNSLGSATTDANGVATKSFSSNTTGSHSITAVCGGVTSSAVTVTVVGYAKIVMSADKSILSYADNDKATLYAQLKDASNNNISVSGVTITFKNGSTTLGTADTDANGKATLTDGYTSAGVGDISLTAGDGTLVSETYSIPDKIIYDLSSNDGLSHFGNVYEVEGKTSATISYDSTESAYKLLSTGNGLKTIPLTCLTGKDSFKLSFDIKPVSNTYYGSGVICLGTNHSGSGVAFGREGNTTLQTLNHTFLNNSWNNNSNLNYSFTSGTWYTFEMTVDGTEISIDIKTGGTVVKSVTFDLLDKSSTLFNTLTDRQYAFSIGYDTNNQRVSYIKNIQAEPL